LKHLAVEHTNVNVLLLPFKNLTCQFVLFVLDVRRNSWLGIAKPLSVAFGGKQPITTILLNPPMVFWKSLDLPSLPLAVAKPTICARRQQKVANQYMPVPLLLRFPDTNRARPSQAEPIFCAHFQPCRLTLKFCLELCHCFMQTVVSSHPTQSEANHVSGMRQ
jgi:hypothetical protein